MAPPPHALPDWKQRLRVGGKRLEHPRSGLLLRPPHAPPPPHTSSPPTPPLRPACTGGAQKHVKPVTPLRLGAPCRARANLGCFLSMICTWNSWNSKGLCPLSTRLRPADVQQSRTIPNVCHWRQRPQKHNFVATKVLSRQAYFRRDKRRVLILVATPANDICLCSGGTALRGRNKGCEQWNRNEIPANASVYQL